MSDIPLSVLLRSAMKVDANINRELEQKELGLAIAKVASHEEVITSSFDDSALDSIRHALPVDDTPVISAEPLAALFPDAGDDEPDTALGVLQNGTDENGNGQGLESGNQEPGNSEGQQGQALEVLDQGQGEEVTPAPVVTSPWEEPQAATPPKVPTKSSKAK